MAKKTKTTQKKVEERPNRLPFLGPVIGFIAGFVIATAAWKSLPPDPANAAARSSGGGIPAAPFLVGTENKPFHGPRDAVVTIVEFTDFECPYCRRYFQSTYPQIVAEYGDQIRYVARNFPLRSIHPHAQKAAEAAECAFDQNRYWEYHDVLFSNASNLRVPDLKQYALDLDLDASVFNRCLDSGSKTALVEADVREGLSLGIRGTPAFFVNGHAISGAQPFEVFQRYIEALSQ